MTIDEVVTLASIIEMEAKYLTDYEKISSVLHNRLNSRAFPYLQVDVTLQYARIIRSWKIQILTNKDKEIDSPYNTYTNKGFLRAYLFTTGRGYRSSIVSRRH